MSDNPSKFSTKFEKLQIEREDETLNSSGDTAFDESKKESTNITKENPYALLRARTTRYKAPEANQSGNVQSTNPTPIESNNRQSGQLIEYALDKIENFHEDIKFIQKWICSLSSENSSFRYPIKAKLEEEFKLIINVKRSQRKFYFLNNKIELTPIEFVDDETARTIRQLFLYGTDEPGSFARNLATYIFGVDILVKTLMIGVDNVGLLIGNDEERRNVFTKEQTLQVVNLFKLIDEEFFSQQYAFEHLIRDPMNQLGRDLKKKGYPKKSQNPNSK